MSQYVKNLLPRLKEYGKNLDRTERFVDKTWTLVDTDGCLKTYRFKRSGVLRISLDGNYTDHKWELEGPDALAISQPGKRSGEIYKHGFIVDGLLIVQKEGSRGTPTIFYDDKLVVDGDVSSYMRSTLAKKMGLSPFPSMSGFYYKSYTDASDVKVGSEVFDDELNPVGDTIISADNNKIVIVKGKVKRCVTSRKYNTDRGPININTVDDNDISVGDTVTTGRRKVADGIYKLETEDDDDGVTISVEDGKIVRIKGNSRHLYWIILIIVFFLAVMAAAMIADHYNQNARN